MCRNRCKFGRTPGNSNGRLCRSLPRGNTQRCIFFFYPFCDECGKFASRQEEELKQLWNHVTNATKHLGAKIVDDVKRKRAKKGNNATDDRSEELKRKQATLRKQNLSQQKRNDPHMTNRMKKKLKSPPKAGKKKF